MHTLLLAALAATFVIPNARLDVDDATGAILALRTGPGAKSVWRSGEHGLWRVQFTNGLDLCAADFATNGCRVVREGNAFRYDHPLVSVKVAFETSQNGFDLRGEVAAKTALPAVGIDLPARLRFAPEAVDRFYMPQKGNEGMGFALKSAFFAPAPPDRPTGWRNANARGVYGYGCVFGGPVGMRPLADEPVEVTVTPEGRRLLPPAVVKDLEGRSRHHVVNRACRPGQFDVTLVDSPHGPFLSGSHLGGTGTLWRVGTTEAGDERQLRVQMMEGLLASLVRKPAAGRGKIAAISLPRGPVTGAFAGGAVAAYVNAARNAAASAGLSFETLASPKAVRRALALRDYAAILSPYGEYFPVDRAEDFKPALLAVRDWVRAGGHWLEVGGASFYSAYVPRVYASYERPYPNLFMDFFVLRTTDGASCALFGVRPRPPHEPWRNKRENFFRPGALGCGGDEKGGWATHAFRLWTRDGAVETLPAVRLAPALPLQAAIDAYAKANDLGRPLADKMDPAQLDVLKKALFIKMGGRASEIQRLVPDLPKPTTLHVAQYLMGGFDKQYPDHLPSNERAFGTDAEHRALIDALHAHGHLYAPYTNPTWWCDNPPGPSFVAAGKAPLAIGLNGQPYHEQYARNDGWTITYWHPAVQAANRRTVRQFTTALPVDVLFQDQCGARVMRYDFNPFSPTPLAYTEGQLAMNEEDCRLAPLATEDGWDRAAENQVGLFGVSWYTVPLHLVPVRHARPLAKSEIAPETWEFEPLAARLMHTRTLFWMHDLGAFVTNPRVFAWMLALGYNMSACTSAYAYEHDAKTRQWLAFLAHAQRAVCSRIAGQPLRAWRHDRSALLARTDITPEDGRDDGLVTAQWGDVSCVVNLGDVPRKAPSGLVLAPYGYDITAPGLTFRAVQGEPLTLIDNGRPLPFPLKH